MLNNNIQDIEKQLITSIYYNVNLLPECAELNEQDFVIPLHALIFKALKNLDERRELVDVTDGAILKAELNRLKANYTELQLSSILANTPFAAPLSYIKEIKEASKKRQLLTLATIISSKSAQADVSTDTIVSEIESRLHALSIDGDTDNFIPMKKLLEIGANEIHRVKNKGFLGLSSGFRELDNLTTGFNKGELIIVGGRPGMGKTSLVLSMVLNFLNLKKVVALFSLEMSPEQLMLRFYSGVSLTPLYDLRSGALEDERIGEITARVDIFGDKKLFVEDTRLNLNIITIRNKLRRLKHKEGLDVVVIDYLQLMGGTRSFATKNEEVSEITRGLKLLARELEVPIIALSQLNRGLDSRDDKRPILSDLRDSGSIEQDADVIVFLYRDDVYKERAISARIAKAQKEGIEPKIERFSRPLLENAELIIAKNRNGETKSVNITFNSKYTLFQDNKDNAAYAIEEAKSASYFKNTHSFNKQNIDISIN